MKKIVALLLLLTSCMCLNAYAKNDSSLHLSTSASEEYTPNTVEITFAVETKNKDAGVAAQNNKQITNNVMEIIKKELNTSKGDSIKTKSFNVSPRYYYKDSKQIFDTYVVTNTFAVTLKDISKIGEITSLALKNGVNNVNNLSFSLDKTDAYCTELMSKAAKSAKERANAIAKAMDKKIVGVQNVSVSCSNENNYHILNRNYMSAKATFMDGAGAVEESVPIEAGILKINASFNGSFLIK